MLIKHIAKGLLGLGILVLIGAAWYTYDPLSTEIDAADYRQVARQYDVEIIRDSWGVPQIAGRPHAETAFGVAYAPAEEDYETIQEVVAAVRGQLARYYGRGAAPTDYIVSLMDIWGTIAARFEADVPADIKAIARAYADGLNLYAAENPKATWAGLVPFQAEDVVAGFIFKTPFFYGFDDTLKSLIADSRDIPMAQDPDTQTWLLSPSLNTARGSNAFAVTPARSGDGATRLMINTHQPLTGPVAWWEAHTVSQEGLDITGGLFPGTPVILHGFNRHLGWANTVSKPDLTDIYRLTINPDNPDQYLLDGTWRDFEIETARLRVKLFGPFALPVKREVYRSEHGPVIRVPHGTYAIRYAGMGEIRQMEQYVRLNHTRNYAEFDAAMALNALPSINYVYADKDGTIAFIHNGQYPDRIPDWDWQNDLPGDRSDLIWQTYIPYAEGPKLINPESGFVYNANNTPFSATDGTDNLTPDMFPAWLGLQINQTNRALRIQELTDGTRPIDRDRLLDLKFDTVYARQSKAATFVAQALNTDWSGDAKLAAAAEHLGAWDFATGIDNRHAALGVLTVLRHLTGQFTGDYGPPAPDAFAEAVDWLNTHHGRIDPSWGEVNRLIRADVNLPVSGGPDILRAIYPLEMGDDGILKAAAGDSWIALVEWDTQGTISADVIHPFGSATQDRASPHHVDQTPLFAAEKWRSALLDRAEIEADATRIYRPGHKKE